MAKAKFSSPGRQAASVMKAMQGEHLRSVGTVRNYEQALTRVAEWVCASRLVGGLRELTPSLAISYLESRGESVGQKTLDMERQAIQAMMHHVTNLLPLTARLPVVRSDHPQILAGRAYTTAQITRICTAQTIKNALATELAYAAGLRAHELYTLARPDEQPPSARQADETKWAGRDGITYTVHGKGGLVREVHIPKDLALRLEAVRRDNAVILADRGVNHTSRYALGGGHPWSNSFSAAAQRVLGWSAGAHGVRHSYAQERMRELQHQGLSREASLTTVSQEMGHFRPEITETYLR
ncbi:site-specific integrase [Pectobacterium punjabense]|uniref:site-specific integrase n=1 Tax=Pectobacterium punjabense TaxID=2108399 RepID=UPI001F1EA1F0|nr:site-specific integrase [Pectobacterium punjabense]MCE5380591.1 site-specific integrase [Pectobacterium punjabense]